MKIIRLATAVSMLVFPTLAGSTTVQAQTVTQDAGVAVHRGVDAATDQRQVTKTRTGVTVHRGSSPTPTAASVPVRAQPRLQVRGGDNLWIVDPASGEVVGCDLTRTVYGTREVRCTSDR